MITVRVTCDTGRTWVTGINAAPREAFTYFMGQKFINEDDLGNEYVHVVTTVEIIEGDDHAKPS